MFNKILNAMTTSITYNTLDVKKLTDGMRDFIKCISVGKLSDSELDNAKYFSRTIKSDVILTYVIIDSMPKDRLRGDTVDRMGVTHIILYKYLQEELDDAGILDRMRLDAIGIIRSIYDISTKIIPTEKMFENFDSITTKNKMIILAPYILVCKLFDKANVGIYTGGNFIIQKALNCHNIPQVDEIIKFILTEHPDIDTLFNLNGFMLPFAKENKE